MGEKWKEKYAEDGFKYEREIQKRWNKLNDKVFSAFESFGFRLPNYWLAYPVTPWRKVIPFSSPLTFRISKNWNEVFTTLIHELSHVELTYSENQKLSYKISCYIQKTFAKEDQTTKIHIPVDLLQISVMAKIFPKKYKKMIKRQKSFSYQKRTWEILEENKKNINLQDPVSSILSLS
ncbi:MAG: hypothetical protein ACOZBZ_03015 [Patescibacteria group bacterium]